MVTITLTMKLASRMRTTAPTSIMMAPATCDLCIRQTISGRYLFLSPGRFTFPSKFDAFSGLDFFNSSYLSTPPWDIGHPQREFVRLADAGEVKGDVIDLGCGTGENAMMLAAKGNRVLGIDSAPLAIAKARKKAEERRSTAEFEVANALELQALGRTFDSAIDCGLFHTFSDRQRKVFSVSLMRALRPGGRYFMLCFSDDEPADWGGPRRVSKEEIVETFRQEWRIDSTKPARFEAAGRGEGGRAWLASLTRLA